MPGQAGSATAPGQERVSASNASIEISGDEATVGAGGSITSEELRMIGYPGLSVNVDRSAIVGGGNVAVTVQVRVQSDTSPWITLGAPAALAAVAPGTAVFNAWDHLAVRQARVVLTAAAGTVVGPTFLMGAAT